MKKILLSAILAATLSQADSGFPEQKLSLGLVVGAAQSDLKSPGTSTSNDADGYLYGFDFKGEKRLSGTNIYYGFVLGWQRSDISKSGFDFEMDNYYLSPIVSYAFTNRWSLSAFAGLSAMEYSGQQDINGTEIDFSSKDLSWGYNYGLSINYDRGVLSQSLMLQRHIHSGVENEVDNGNSSTVIRDMDYENTALMYRIGMRF